MKVRQYINMMGMTAAVLLSSCVKDELHDTPHPDYGKITVTADWTDRGDGVDIPAEWTVTMGDYTGTETGATHAPDYLFNPGSYTLAAYNTPENITISGTTATVAPETGNGAYISNAPGWLFTSVQEVEIEADTDYSLTAVMRQQVRELTLVIEPAGDAVDRIETIEGTLTGEAKTTGTSSDLTMDATGITSSSLILFPQAVTEATLKVVLGGQNYTATLTFSKANAVQGLESGYSYKYNVTIYKEELNITKANIEPWVDASVENDGNVDATI